VPTGLVTTTRLTTERLTALPLDPVIVIGYDPAVAPGVVRVNREPPDPAMVGEENAAVTCGGRPEALSVTKPVNAFTGITDTAYVAVAPLWTALRAAG
jgi:hypothetical protein